MGWKMRVNYGKWEDYDKGRWSESDKSSRFIRYDEQVQLLEIRKASLTMRRRQIMNNMEVEEVERRVEHLKEIAGDNETAHKFEDQLWEDVLTAIAEGNPNPIRMARTALLTSEVGYNRWYA